MQRLHVHALAFLCIGLVGCGSDGMKRVQVRGKVTAKGAPVDNATIQFIPITGTKGEGGMGRTDDNGSYTMDVGSRRGDKGVVPGEYSVLVSRWAGPDGRALTGDWKQADNPNAKETIPPKYSAGPSGLKVSVLESGGEINIEIPESIAAKKK